MLVWFDYLSPCQKLFNYIGAGLPGLSSTKRGVLCFAQGHNQVTQSN